MVHTSFKYARACSRKLPTHTYITRAYYYSTTIYYNNTRIIATGTNHYRLMLWLLFSLLSLHNKI